MLDALEAVNGSLEAKNLLRPILEIVNRAISSGIQQEFFTNFQRYATEPDLPRQGIGNLRIALDLNERDLEAARGELLDIAVAGSEWIWETASDAMSAAVFEVLCDILDEGLPPAEQQALLDANLADVAR